MPLSLVYIADRDSTRPDGTKVKPIGVRFGLPDRRDGGTNLWSVHLGKDGEDFGNDLVRAGQEEGQTVTKDRQDETNPRVDWYRQGV